MRSILRFLADESGPTAVEYAVMLAFIIATCFAVIKFVGLTSANLWGDNSTSIGTVLQSGS